MPFPTTPTPEQVTVTLPHQDTSSWSPNTSTVVQEDQSIVREVFAQRSNSTSPTVWQPCVSQPSATFTPTVAGFRPEEGHSSSIPQEMCNLIDLTVAKSIVTALTRRVILAPSSALVPAQQLSRASLHLDNNAPSATCSPSHSHHSDQSLLDEEKAFDYSLSGD